MGIELELTVLYLIQTLGHGIFDRFEVETPAWRKITKWTIVAVLTVLLYQFFGHWSLLIPLAAGIVGVMFHYVWCRKNGIHPLQATPRQKYYELRGWPWPQ